MAYAGGAQFTAPALLRKERWPGRYRAKGIPLVYPGQEVKPDQPILRLENGTPVTVPAGMYGRVLGFTRRGGVVIETYAAILRGAIGAGNQVAGILTLWQSPAPNRPPPPIPPGAILVIPGPVNFTMLRQVISSGIVGVVASSISSRDLEGFLGTDLIKLVSSIDVELAQAHLPPITLLFTEGPGAIAMPAHTINLLSQYQGAIALISGATSVRRGIFPELIISLPPQAGQSRQFVPPDLELVIGTRVHVTAGEHAGAAGYITYLFSHRQAFAPGVCARAARVRLEDGSMLVVPLTHLERIG